MAKSPALILAADLMTPAPRTCSKFSTVTEAVMIFRDADCGIVPIVDEGKPIGVVTDRDVALAVPDYPDLASRAVSDIMTRDVVSVPPDMPLDKLKHEFGANQVRRLLVVDGTGKLLGVVSWKDVAKPLSDDDVGEVVTEVVETP